MNKIKQRLLDEAEDILKTKEIGDKSLSQVLIGLKFDDGHLHLHTPDDTIFKKEVAQNLTESDNNDRKIIFAHKRAVGDALMFSAGVRDFKLLFPDIRINVDSSQPWIWENNPYIDRSLKKEDKDVEYYDVGYPAIASANNTYVHFTMAFLLDMIAITDLHKSLPVSLGEFCSAFANGEVGDPCLGKPDKNANSHEPFISLVNQYKNFGKSFARQRGDIHLSEDEKKHDLIQKVYGYNKYWLIAPGGKRDATTKIWDWRRFQEVIDHFEGKIKFVVIGRSDHLVEKLNNIIDLTDKFNDNMRPLVSLVYHADGCISGISMLMHLAAAIPSKYTEKGRKPCVVIEGGRESKAWTEYCNHQILHTNGVFTCCDNGGCWKSRIIPIPKDPKQNKNLCKSTTSSDGRTIQECMDVITSDDVIRAIKRYYEGDIYTYMNRRDCIASDSDDCTTCVACDKVNTDDAIKISNSFEIVEKTKSINLLGSLSSHGGGEQSLIKIADVLGDAGWDVQLFPWDSVHENYKDIKSKNVHLSNYSFKPDGGRCISECIENTPLLFYGNDNINDFLQAGKKLVDKCSILIIGINYMFGHLKNPDISEWLIKSNKLKAVIFQNEEKKQEWERQVIGFDNTKKIVLFGAIDMNKFYEVCTKPREKDEPLIVLKHCTPDYRKYTTNESVKNGSKIHIWQKHLDKELDTKFYQRLLKDTKNTQFWFMEAHKELAEFFKDEPRMKFFKWDEIPVEEFLSKGHIYLYRTSNMWRDNYPRCIAEALATGLPILSEPRDGTKDRIIHGDTGYYFTHYDECLVHLSTLIRKEKFRQALGQNAKDWAKANLDPAKWNEVIIDIYANS